jgi:hypothetical protein
MTRCTAFRPHRNPHLDVVARPPTAAAAGSRAAVVATVKNFVAMADSWCSYHLGIGFAHLFLYFDDPAELAVIDLASRFPASSVTAVPHDDRLRAAWSQMPYGDLGVLLRHAELEVQTR